MTKKVYTALRISFISDQLFPSVLMHFHAGLPAPQPMDNPTYVSTPPLAVSPVCGSTTDDSAGYAYHEFDNPIYGSK